MDPTARTRFPPRSSQRGRDIALVAVALLIGLVAAVNRAGHPGAVPPWLLQLDQAAGLLGCLALWWRRRFPVVLAVVLIAAATVAETVTGAVLVALFTAAVHRPVRTAVALFGAALAALTCYQLLRPEAGVRPELIATSVVAMCVAALCAGLDVRNRRRLVASLRERAAAAEVEARLRAERAQLAARETLAQEVHDVLAHRLSLLSVHAGALVYHPDAAPDDIARAAEVIRENSHRALQDLRDVVGVLRAPTGELPRSGPVGEP